MDYLQRFDEFCMKPIFIRKYTPEAEKLADEFINTYIEDGNKIENEFSKAPRGGSLQIQKTMINTGKRFSVSH